MNIVFYALAVIAVLYLRYLLEEKHDKEEAIEYLKREAAKEYQRTWEKFMTDNNFKIVKLSTEQMVMTNEQDEFCFQQGPFDSTITYKENGIVKKEWKVPLEEDEEDVIYNDIDVWYKNKQHQN